MENIRIPMFLAIQLGISILTLIYVDGNNKEGARTSRRLSFTQVPPSTSTTDKYGKVHAPMGHEPTACLFSLFEIGGFVRREQEQFAQVMICVKRLSLTSVINIKFLFSR